jgi:hypothetical protein
MDWRFWCGLPWHWLTGAVRNGHDILRVLDLLHWRPVPAGLVDLKHPWVTGRCPMNGEWIWPQNVIYRTAPCPRLSRIADDDVVLQASGRFLANRVRQSAVMPELPIGPARRMPHAINYMHGSSHYNSGIILLNDIREGFQHVNDARFRRELRRFVREERREVLFLFRDRSYEPREYAYLSCAMRSRFRWFCNPNGPGPRILWGNYGPFPAANLITGHWADDVYALRMADGATRVARSPIAPRMYFQESSYGLGRDHALWPEKLLAHANQFRVRIRGGKGGMFFVDRRVVYKDQTDRRTARGLPPEERVSF